MKNYFLGLLDRLLDSLMVTFIVIAIIGGIIMGFFILETIGAAQYFFLGVGIVVFLSLFSKYSFF